MLGIVGDSGSGKTTITRGLVRVLGEDQVTHFCTDDYHRYDRRQRAERNITPLDPECNHLDILAQHLGHLRRKRADHEARLPALRRDVRRRPTTSCPAASSSARGCSASTTASSAESFDVRVYLDPPEELRRHWKVQRDCSRRGYTTDQVLSELDRREPDSERWIRPQRHHADIVVSFQPGARRGPGAPRLQADALRLAPAPRPDRRRQRGRRRGIVAGRAAGRRGAVRPGRLPHERASAIEEAIWEKMHFARHLREERLGEFTIGTDLHRSDSLAVVQLLILYHLMMGRIEQATGGPGQRIESRRSSGDDSALFL